MPRTWKEWTTRELAFLDKHYPAGMSLDELARRVGHSRNAVKTRAQSRGLKHPNHCSQQAIWNFEARYSLPLAAIARQYRDRHLSRQELANDIGINPKTLRDALPDELWQSWPRMTIGRIDAARQRRKAA